MIRPWFKFYPGDWRADPALRSCSVAARGLWMEMLCIMHEAKPRGSLLINGLPVSGKQLAMLVGIPLKDTLALLGELAGAGVFSREDGGTIYSRRIRRDEERSEEGREAVGKRWPRREPIRSPTREPCTEVDEKNSLAPTTLEARSQKEIDRDTPADARGESLLSPESFSITSELLAAWGMTFDSAPLEWSGLTYSVQAWLTMGCDRNFIMTNALGKKPRHLRYLDAVIKNAWKERAEADQASDAIPPFLQRKRDHRHENGRHRGAGGSAITAAIDRHIERFEREAGDGGEVCETPAGLLSDGRC